MEATVDKCLAFCQALAMSNQRFSLNLTIDKDNFTFSDPGNLPPAHLLFPQDALTHRDYCSYYPPLKVLPLPPTPYCSYYPAP